MIFNIEDSVYREANSTPLTPEDVACDMIQLVRDTGFFDEVSEGTDLVKWAECHRVCDIYCKSGVFLMICFWLFMRSLMVVIDDFEARKKFVIDNLLYGFSPNRGVCRLLRADLYNNVNRLGHIYELDLKDETKVKEIFGDMKFDVVVGNPPYNNDEYLDFVTLGHKLSKQYSLWITPAKFIGMDDSDNEKFRGLFRNKSTIVNYWSSAVSVFNIQLDGGLCYYLLNNSGNNDNIVLNGKVVKASSVVSFDIVLLEIIDKIKSISDGCYNDYVFNVCKSYFCSKQPVEVEETSGTGYFLINDRNRVEIDKSLLKHIEEFDNYKVFCVKVNDVPLVHILDKNEVYGRAAVLIGFGDLDYCKSLKSYFESRLIWYLVYFSCCGNINTASFRFVPSQDSFDRIFEDRPLLGYTPDENGEYTDSDGNKHCSLYVKYKLTDEEINVIESVIRERK